MRRLLAIILVALPAVCCTKPGSYEEFIRAKDASEGVYSFDLDMSDEGCSYDISLFTKLDTRVFGRRTSESMPLAVIWSSGDSLSFSETVYYPLDRTIVPYRSGVVLQHPGNWTIRFNVLTAPKGLRGLGIICKRNDNGTRQTSEVR